jgi:hypothetical protein
LDLWLTIGVYIFVFLILLVWFQIIGGKELVVFQWTSAILMPIGLIVYLYLGLTQNAWLTFNSGVYLLSMTTMFVVLLFLIFCFSAIFTKWFPSTLVMAQGRVEDFAGVLALLQWLVYVLELVKLF